MSGMGSFFTHPTTRWGWSVPANSGTTVSVKTCCIVREERDMHIDPDSAVGAGLASLLCTQTSWWTVCPAASFHASRTERVRRDYSPFAPATSPHLTSRTPSSQTGKAKGSTTAADGCRATGVCQPFHFRFYPRRPLQTGILVVHVGPDKHGLRSIQGCLSSAGPTGQAGCRQVQGQAHKRCVGM